MFHDEEAPEGQKPCLSVDGEFRPHSNCEMAGCRLMGSGQVFHALDEPIALSLGEDTGGLEAGGIECAQRRAGV